MPTPYALSMTLAFPGVTNFHMLHPLGLHATSPTSLIVINPPFLDRLRGVNVLAGESCVSEVLVAVYRSSKGATNGVSGDESTLFPMVRGAHSSYENRPRLTSA